MLKTKITRLLFGILLLIGIFLNACKVFEEIEVKTPTRKVEVKVKHEAPKHHEKKKEHDDDDEKKKKEDSDDDD